VKIAVDMGRRSTGLDKAEANPNAVNIAVLGDIGMFENEAAVFKGGEILNTASLV